MGAREGERRDVSCQRIAYVTDRRVCIRIGMPPESRDAIPIMLALPSSCLSSPPPSIALRVIHNVHLHGPCAPVCRRL